jgi:hypothetical protein
LYRLKADMLLGARPCVKYLKSPLSISFPYCLDPVSEVCGSEARVHRDCQWHVPGVDHRQRPKAQCLGVPLFDVDAHVIDRVRRRERRQRQDALDRREDR